jgi:hypothetical protein
MTKEEFKNANYIVLAEKGYKEVKIINGKAYNGRDMYYCPQAPNLYMLTILPGRTDIKKIGDNTYSASLSTEVNGPDDIDRLHEEINNVIYNGNQSSLKNKATGCFATILILTIPSSIIIFHFFF